MDIDKSSPAFARREVLIHAPVEKVWQIQTDIANWSQWQPDIAYARLDSDLKPGATFRWKAQGLNIASRLHTVEPPHRIGWTGVALGMSAIHNWTFEAQGDVTRVTTEESLSGWLTRLMVFFDPQFLEKSLEATLQRLRSKVEEM